MTRATAEVALELRPRCGHSGGAGRDISSSTTTLPYGSTTTLPLEQSARSAHKYIKEEGLAERKEKVKTRGTAAGLDAVPEKAWRKGLFSVFKRKSKDKGKDEDEEEMGVARVAGSTR